MKLANGKVNVMRLHIIHSVILCMKKIMLFSDWELTRAYSAHCNRRGRNPHPHSYQSITHSMDWVAVGRVLHGLAAPEEGRHTRLV